jgi:hypothetical protein
VAAEAGRVIGTRSVKSLVHGGALKGIFVKCRNGNGTECWITRESLTRWVAERDGKRASYMRRAEADLVLGLKRGVMLKLAHEGLMRSVNGIEHRLSHGIHLRRDDVMNIKDAFDRYLPLNRNLHPGAILPLAGIIRRLTRTYELGAILRAVVAGTLVPVAHEKHLPGITAYCFPIARSKGKVVNILAAKRWLRSCRFPAKPSLNLPLADSWALQVSRAKADQPCIP